MVVDPAPVRGGLLNGTQAVGFDAAGALVISYLRYDAAGNTQLYLARWEAGKWAIRQASDWTYRWDFHGAGSLVNEIHIGPPTAVGSKLSVAVDHTIYGSGIWTVDPVTLRLKGKPVATASRDRAK